MIRKKAGLRIFPALAGALAGALAAPLFSAPLGPVDLSLSNRLVLTRALDSASAGYNDWLDLLGRYGPWSAGLRAEALDPDAFRNPSARLRSRYLQFQREWLRIRAGNFYEQLGRGLVFDAFEIQNQSLAGAGRSADIDRNVDGANVKLAFDRLELTAIYGWPLDPVLDDRGEPLGGGEVIYRPWYPVQIGGTALRMQAVDFRGVPYSTDLGSAEAGISLAGVEFYGEAAGKFPSDTLRERRGNAIYLSASYSAPLAGASLEFKRYDDFRTDFNNPPSLVKTHSFALFTRNMHTLSADDETGFQGELSYSPVDATTFTLNAARTGDLAGLARREFREYFLENRTNWSEGLNTRALLDYSRDRIVGDLNRWGAAQETEVSLSGRNSIIADGQFQWIENEYAGPYWKSLGLLSFSRSPWLTFSLQYDHLSKASAFAPRRDWFSAVASLKLGGHHDVMVTAGSRPSGKVCSGGICFVVPEFEGVELRWNLRW